MQTASKLLVVLAALALSLTTLAPAAFAEDNDPTPNQDVDIAACRAAGGQPVIHSGTSDYIACVFLDDDIVCDMFPGGGPIKCEWISGQPPERPAGSSSIDEPRPRAEPVRDDIHAPAAPTRADTAADLLG